MSRIFFESFLRIAGTHWGNGLNTMFPNLPLAWSRALYFQEKRFNSQECSASYSLKAIAVVCPKCDNRLAIPIIADRYSDLTLDACSEG